MRLQKKRFSKQKVWDSVRISVSGRSIIGLIRWHRKCDGSAFSGVLNGRNLRRKVRATSDMANIVTQFIGDLKRVRYERISNMKDGLDGGLSDSLWRSL